MARPTVRGWGLLDRDRGRLPGGPHPRHLGALSPVARVPGGAAGLLVPGAATTPDLTVERTLAPDRPAAGDAIRLTLRAENGSRLPGLQVTVRGAAGDLSEEDGEVQIESLPSSGGACRHRRAGPAHRGVHHLPPLQVDAEDPLGLVRARPDVRSGGRRDRLPASCRPDTRACRSPTWADNTTEPAWVADLGGAEFRGIRPHHPGRTPEPCGLEDHGQDRRPDAPRDGRARGRRRDHALDGAAQPCGRTARRRTSNWPCRPPAPSPPSRCGPAAASRCCCRTMAGRRLGCRLTPMASSSCSRDSPGQGRTARRSSRRRCRRCSRVVRRWDARRCSRWSCWRWTNGWYGPSRPSGRPGGESP